METAVVTVEAVLFPHIMFCKMRKKFDTLV